MRQGLRQGSLLAVLLHATRLTAQDYTHPREMNLPAPGFHRPDPAEVQVRLRNGLVAYVVEDHTVPLVTLTAFVRVGRADQDRRGQAESLERSLRAGPNGLAAAEFQRELERMTAEFAVTVGPDLTQVTLNVPSEDAWRALELFGGLLRRPHPMPASEPRRADLPADQAASESGPVLYEGSMPVAVRLFEDLLYRDHPYGLAGGGTTGGDVTETEIADFHRRFFVPSSTIVAIAGDVATVEARQQLERFFGDWRGARPSRSTLLPSLPTAGGGRMIHTFDVDKLQGWLVMGHELPVVAPQDEAALAVMNYVLAGDHLAGRMFLEARDRRGLANDEIGHPEPRLRGPGTYTFRAAGRPESITQLMDIAFREIARLQAGPVTQEELLVAKGALVDGEFAFQYRNGHATALALAREWAAHEDHRRSATYPERIRAVTAEHVVAVARKYLAADRMRVVLLGPLEAIREAARRGNHPALEQFGTVRAGR
jgi:predicted Zn-dependent peptidase